MTYALVSGQFPWYHDNKDMCANKIKYSDLKFPEEASKCSAAKQKIKQRKRKKKLKSLFCVFFAYYYHSM